MTLNNIQTALRDWKKSPNETYLYQYNNGEVRGAIEINKNIFSKDLEFEGVMRLLDEVFYLGRNNATNQSTGNNSAGQTSI